jgi:hypothetical protein
MTPETLRVQGTIQSVHVPVPFLKRTLHKIRPKSGLSCLRTCAAPINHALLQFHSTLHCVAFKESDRHCVNWFQVAYQFSKVRHVNKAWEIRNAAVTSGGGGVLPGAMAPKREMQGKLFKYGEKGVQVRKFCFRVSKQRMRDFLGSYVIAESGKEGREA